MTILLNDKESGPAVWSWLYYIVTRTRMSRIAPLRSAFSLNRPLYVGAFHALSHNCHPDIHHPRWGSSTSLCTFIWFCWWPNRAFCNTAFTPLLYPLITSITIIIWSFSSTAIRCCRRCSCCESETASIFTFRRQYLCHFPSFLFLSSKLINFVCRLENLHIAPTDFRRVQFYFNLVINMDQPVVLVPKIHICRNWCIRLDSTALLHPHIAYNWRTLSLRRLTLTLVFDSIYIYFTIIDRYMYYTSFSSLYQHKHKRTQQWSFKRIVNPFDRQTLLPHRLASLLMRYHIHRLSSDRRLSFTFTTKFGLTLND